MLQLSTYNSKTTLSARPIRAVAGNKRAEIFDQLSDFLSKVSKETRVPAPRPVKITTGSYWIYNCLQANRLSVQ